MIKNLIAGVILFASSVYCLVHNQIFGFGICFVLSVLILAVTFFGENK